MSARVWTCQGCGTKGVQTTNGRLRQWCSDRCRKRSYDLVCVDCGGRVDGTTPGKMANRDEPVCGRCAAGHYATWTREAILCAIEEWADEHGGIPPTALDFLRAKACGRDDVPTLTHVQYRFGSWNAAIIAAGFEPHAGGPVGGFMPLTAEQRRECARRYAAGESSSRIAADLGCSPAMVIKWARRHGVAIRPAFTTSDPSRDQRRSDA